MILNDKTQTEQNIYRLFPFKWSPKRGKANQQWYSQKAIASEERNWLERGMRESSEATVLDFTLLVTLNHVLLFVIPWTSACQASLSITNSWSPPKLMSTESVLPSNDLILCHPLLLQPSVFPSMRDFSNESVLRIRWPKYWSFSFNISLSNEHPGLISFRMDWLDLLAVQGTLKSLLQHHSTKALILLCSALFIVPTLNIHIWPLEKP